VIVVDTNVIAGAFLGRATPCAEEYVLARDPEWAVPLLWRSEFRSVLAGEMRRGRMNLDKAARIANRAEAWVRDREFSVPSDAILDLVARTRCTAYDCEFVALAQRLAVPLVTGDRQVLAAFPKTAVSPEAFSAH
jgi:predicted nucleic acid-binding protein